ncbi:MAG: 4-deoxy-4-formamido-L-arabinose-phosphoundecaprenol deformylase [Thermodesulfobacteriota bacterium]|nr:4-deoxy-4-formamido-L-arabinose-phosphoundecaprenol deformylase [Thermodesulfobacteriota bacterium]
MIIGLRIDVDTYRGTRYGVPNLCRVLAEHSISASFFFSVGPDNMGRHLWRLLRPAFLLKMLRTKATSLYGWDILLKGTFWPGPVIGENLGSIIRSVSDAGHECGLHAWDHHAWQAHIDTMDSDAIHRSIRKGMETLTKILGHTPSCSAVPGWKCNDLVLMEKEKYPFYYNSDCRGEDIFYPVVKKRNLSVPQVPVTLPTYDEIVGHEGISNKNYNDYILSIVKPDRLNVMTIHAEVEGIFCVSMFDRFLAMAREKGITFVPLGKLLPESQEIGQAILTPKEIHGREGWVSCQENVGDVGS